LVCAEPTQQAKAETVVVPTKMTPSAAKGAGNFVTARPMSRKGRKRSKRTKT